MVDFAMSLKVVLKYQMTIKQKKTKWQVKLNTYICSDHHTKISQKNTCKGHTSTLDRSTGDLLRNLFRNH